MSLYSIKSGIIFSSSNFYIIENYLFVYTNGFPSRLSARPQQIRQDKFHRCISDLHNLLSFVPNGRNLTSLISHVTQSLLPLVARDQVSIGFRIVAPSDHDVELDLQFLPLISYPMSCY